MQFNVRGHTITLDGDHIVRVAKVRDERDWLVALNAFHHSHYHNARPTVDLKVPAVIQMNTGVDEAAQLRAINAANRKFWGR